MALLRDDFSNAQAFLAAHPAVKTVDLLLPDLCGVLRGKRLDASDLATVYENGMYLPGSMFALDVMGGTIQATGLGFDEGDADRPCVPVPGSLFAAPWMGPGVAQLQVQMLDHDLQPFFGDPRHVLDTVLARYARARLAAGRRDRARILLRGPGAHGRRPCAAAAVAPDRPPRASHADQFHGGPQLRFGHPVRDCDDLRASGCADRHGARRVRAEPVGSQSAACRRCAPRLRPGDPVQAHRQGRGTAPWARSDIHGQAL